VDNPTGDFETFKMSPDGTGLVQLTRNNISDSDPAFSPDGKQIAFDSLRGFNSEIYTMSSSNGTSQTNLTNSAKNDLDPVFSPDGKQIIFTSNRDDDGGEVYKMSSSDGSSHSGAHKG
jgi:Tol biopolymer transport system component